MSSSSLAITSNTRQLSGSRPRPPSALSAHSKESPLLGAAHSKPGSLSRTPSTRTVTQSRLAVQPNSTELNQRSFRSSFGSQRKGKPSLENVRGDSSPSPPPPSVSSSASSDNDDGVSQSVARSQVFRRPLDLRTISSGDDGDDDDDDPESSGGFLPFATTTHEDPAATLRAAQAKRAVADRPRQQDIHSSESSASSNAAPQPRTSTATGRMPLQSPTSPADALSPRRRAELAKLSPRVRKEGSEGTPSMGSSFSDLDGKCPIQSNPWHQKLCADRPVDASVTQSALEEALLSNIQHGGMASRMSNMSSALRSKYLQ